MNSEQSSVAEETAASVTNTVIMDNNDNPANIVKVICENNAEHTRPVNNRSNNNDYWAEIENEDLILNIGPPAIVEVKTIAENTTESSPSPSLPISSISTTATTVESVTSRLLRKRDELAKKYGIGEGKHEQTDNKVDLSTTNDGVETTARREQTLDEFKADLRLKRLARQTAVQDLRNEIQTLRSRLVETEDETLQNKEEKLCLNAVAISDADDEDPMSRGRHANIELANVQLALQMANAENLTLSTELATVQKQVIALKEVIACCKQMLVVKEDQCTQLKSKLDEIESSLAERELKLMSNHLRVEYERQLENIRQLRELYEERQRISAAEHENLQRLISLKRDELKAEQEKTKTAEERNQTLLQDLEKVNTELAALREECDEHKFEKKALKEEIGTVNTLFSQMVTGFNGRDNLDIDRLTTMLEENRTLLNDMATKEMANDGATLPKLLFELVEQAAVSSEKNTSRSTTPVTNADADAEAEADAVDNAAEANVDIKTNMKEVTAISEGVAAGGSVGNKQNAEPDVKNDDEDATAICYGTLEETASLQATLHTSPSSFETQEKATSSATASSTATTTTPSTVSTGTCTSGLDATKSGRKHYRRTTPTKATDDMKTTTNTRSVHTGKTMKFAEPEVIGKVVSTQEIIGNLPKVWKVLMELLSHHKIERVPFEENGSSEDCYKSVQTPNGIKTELSVSKTYIKLKDLILEKKSLVKETNRLKTLNCHLEYRLNEQEKRLSTVSLELTKTWHLVGKMQRQHRQLHTQEQILRYQLQQKRRLLSELKDELEYCRRKWALARAKNDESMEQCNDLRREFAKRKIEDANNSTESGYSDSGPPSEDEAGAVLPPVPNCRRIILREMFEHTRKIKRMQSTSPRRAVYNLTSDFNSRSVTLLRCNSAPPSLGFRDSAEFECENDDEEFDIEEENVETPLNNVHVNKGAIPKVSVPRSASVEKDTVADPLEPEVHASRIHRLEEQCKSLIVQVMETSDNRERLEIQLSRLQDEVTPGQYLERMTRASSAPASGCLTPREEEYTRKRSERLGRLEEESKQLMSRIRRTADRGHYLRCSLDRIRRGPSREGSLESNSEEENPSNNMELEVIEKDNNTEEENPANNMEVNERANTTDEASPLTSTEQEYINKRAERLKRLEEESKALLNRVSLHNERTDEISGPVNNIETRINNIDKISENRNERLRILEEEGKALLTKLSKTSARGTAMINRIAEREQRLADSQRNTDSSETEKDDLLKDSTEAAYIPPIPNNVASTSIASPELSEGLVITTTPSQIAYQQGAIPKTLKPNAQLSVSRTKTSKRSADTENLEDLVKSLKNLPYPQDDESKEEEEQETETENLEKNNK